MNLIPVYKGHEWDILDENSPNTKIRISDNDGQGALRVCLILYGDKIYKLLDTIVKGVLNNSIPSDRLRRCFDDAEETLELFTKTLSNLSKDKFQDNQ